MKKKLVAPTAEASPPKAWRLNPSLMISVLAFAVSLATTGLSIVRERTQDINNKKNALHTIFQQHANAVTHRLEVKKAWNHELFDLGFEFGAPEDAQHIEDPVKKRKIGQILDEIKSFNANFALESLTLSKQAQSLVSELAASATAVDLTDVAVLANDTGAPDLPVRLYQKAAEKAGNSIEYLGATLGLAKALLANGRTLESRNAFYESLRVFDKFPEEANAPDVDHRRRFQTYMWAVEHIGADYCDLSRSYLMQAQSEMDALKSLAASTDNISDSFRRSQASLGRCLIPAGGAVSLAQ